MHRFEFDLGVKLRARLLTTVPDSTSLKFILLGTLTRNSKHKGSQGERHVIVYMDFESLGKRKCGDRDMEKWYARTIGGQPDCLMGHKVSRRTAPRFLGSQTPVAVKRANCLVLYVSLTRVACLAAMVHAPEAGRRLRRRREVERSRRTRGGLPVRGRGLRMVRLGCRRSSFS